MPSWWHSTLLAGFYISTINRLFTYTIQPLAHSQSTADLFPVDAAVTRDPCSAGHHSRESGGRNEKIREHGEVEGMYVECFHCVHGIFAVS